MEISEVQSVSQKIIKSVASVIVGKDETVALAVMSLLAGGHMLLEDVPGTGKTLLAKSLARSLGADFKRVQFTPDLLPSDLTGINYFNQKQGEFVFRRGPVFTNILLADEINRATPRTQSSLLECMEERQVSADGVTYPLEEPYFVIATQNPVETQGTYPLPEAQLDRFLVKTSVGYPTPEQEAEILARFGGSDPFDALAPVCTGKEILEARAAAREVYVSPEVAEYLVAAVAKTREHPSVLLGASPRGTLALMKACKAFSAMDGRNFVSPEDVKYLAPFVLTHRIIRREEFESTWEDDRRLVAGLFEGIPAPTENWEGRQEKV